MTEFYCILRYGIDSTLFNKYLCVEIVFLINDSMKHLKREIKNINTDPTSENQSL